MQTLKWRYINNLIPSLAYQFGRQPLSGEAARVLSELNQNGIAMTSADKLLGPSSLYDELKSSVESLERNLAHEIAAAQAVANDPRAHKSFIFTLLGERPVLDPCDICVRFPLQNPILQIANAYFDMYTRLRYYNVWHTLPTRAPARDSQLWHRDPEDHYVLKMFVYLSDVDDGAGPVIYAAGSHPKTGLRREPASSHRKHDAKRSDDNQMAAVLPPDRWIKAVGGKGTIIFADTRGYHKGGLARERDRIMYVCMFTSQASKCPNLFEHPGRISTPLDREQAFALSPD
jgi:hypothetical protein